MLALLRKDLQIEFRTKETLAALLLLGLLTLVVLSFAFDPTSELRGEAAPGALWVAVIFAGVLGLNRSFLAERENECLQGLLLCPVDRGTIYLAKTAGNFLFMVMAQVVIVPIFIFFFNLPVSLGLGGVFLSLALGLLGFAAIGTLFAAISVRTRAREVMLPLLLLPLVVPLLIGAVVATRTILADGLAAARDGLTVLVAFDVVFVVAGWLLFTYVVRD